MKWQGRTESVNVLDLRGVTQLDIQWIDSLSMKGKDILIGTDGKMLDGDANPMINNQAFRKTSLMVGVVAYDLSDPYLLGVQTLAIRKLLRGLVLGGKQVEIMSKSANLKENVRTIKYLME